MRLGVNSFIAGPSVLISPRRLYPSVRRTSSSVTEVRDEFVYPVSRSALRWRKLRFPTTSRRKAIAASSICFSPYLYRARNRVERFFNRIKQCRRVATRYDKLAANYLAFVQLASIRLWLRLNESASLGQSVFQIKRLGRKRAGHSACARNDCLRNAKGGQRVVQKGDFGGCMPRTAPVVLHAVARGL